MKSKCMIICIGSDSHYIQKKNTSKTVMYLRLNFDITNTVAVWLTLATVI